MKEFSLQLANTNRCCYLNFAESIKNAIRIGVLKAGEKLPASRTFSKMLGIHKNTILAGFEELQVEGWIHSKQRKGYWVSETLPNCFFKSKKLKDEIKFSQNNYSELNWDLNKVPSVNLNLVTKNKIRYHFKGAGPDIREFPLDDFRSYLNESIKRAGTKLFSYDSPRGYDPFLDQVSIYLRRVRGFIPQELVVTHGAQEALFIIAQILIKTGDYVAVEELGYQSAFAVFKNFGANLIPIQLDENGIIPEHLEEQVKKQKIKLLYLTPLHQYPTTVTLTIERRLKIYEIAVKNNIKIIEDDYDHEFHYKTQPLPPMAANDPAGIILYVTTFSKIFSPSARIGILAIPSFLLAHVLKVKKIISYQNDLLLQDALWRWMRAGGFEKHLRRMRKIYQERRDVLNSSLLLLQKQLSSLSWRNPNGGMAIWVDLGFSSFEFSKKALRKGVLIGHESEYTSRESNNKNNSSNGNHIRLFFANLKSAEIKEGMQILGELF
ncbi:PLP-dependent aminotransferase family protein [Pigmentibacter sp. JX0631]|uniref:MocR-like pyridoxine biosynthesis transcription factor PdxR n=1 Tax=Pigmentibacter sp. JX0631 TaxID=2976982 RepID=UPI0024697B77|nr:PLP-dependent aminotransferase family protein [Pigmentibacter sp. JX0631]WGL58613.1 PLP-dependent aminotransferase family protein [Pigmentibacter sp. JX0631]